MSKELIYVEGILILRRIKEMAPSDPVMHTAHISASLHYELELADMIINREHSLYVCFVFFMLWNGDIRNFSHEIMDLGQRLDRRNFKTFLGRLES